MWWLYIYIYMYNLYHGAEVYMDYIRARPEGECVYNSYTQKRRGISDIYAD